MKLSEMIRVATTVHVLDDLLYPWLLDRFSHKVARRICSALMVLALVSVLPVINIGVWIYNSLADLGLNFIYGYALAIKDAVRGVVFGQIEADDEADAMDDRIIAAMEKGP